MLARMSEIDPRVDAPNGQKYSVENSSNTGDDVWKDMLAPAS